MVSHGCFSFSFDKTRQKLTFPIFKTNAVSLPLLLAQHNTVLQFFLSPVLLSKSFISSLLANILYAFALSYYHYMNFLGYSALPFLEQTDLFLYPIGLIGIVALFAVLFHFNPAIFTLGIYFG